MAQLIYSLQETAHKLEMSETSLLRLSQYFRVPEAAYAESEGHISFMGEVRFSYSDLNFFRQVRQQVLNGVALGDIQLPRPKSAAPKLRSPQSLKDVDLPAERLASQQFRQYKETVIPQAKKLSVFESMLILMHQAFGASDSEEFQQAVAEETQLLAEQVLEDDIEAALARSERLGYPAQERIGDMPSRKKRFEENLPKQPPPSKPQEPKGSVSAQKQPGVTLPEFSGASRPVASKKAATPNTPVSGRRAERQAFKPSDYANVSEELGTLLSNPSSSVTRREHGVVQVNERDMYQGEKVWPQQQWQPRQTRAVGEKIAEKSTVDPETEMIRQRLAKTPTGINGLQHMFQAASAQTFKQKTDKNHLNQAFQRAAAELRDRATGQSPASE